MLDMSALLRFPRVRVSLIASPRHHDSENCNFHIVFHFLFCRRNENCSLFHFDRLQITFCLLLCYYLADTNATQLLHSQFYNSFYFQMEFSSMALLSILFLYLLHSSMLC